MEGMWGVFGLIFLIGIGIYVNDKRKKKLRKKLYKRELFGTVQEAGEWEENITNYYDTYGEEGVDDITWNDLSMNDIFLRINQCSSSAGEEILYWRIRKGGMEEQERIHYEKLTACMAEDEKARWAIQECLERIGKNRASYFIPSYMDSVDEYVIPYGWVFRLMQILLAIGIAAGMFLRTSEGWFMAGGMAAVNLVLYAVLKMKYEIELNMLGTVVQILENAKRIGKMEYICELFPELKSRTEVFGSVIRGVRFMELQSSSAVAGDASGIFLDYILGVTLWQVTEYNRMLRKLRNHVEDYLEIYKMIGELDGSVSVASFRKSLPWFCRPEFCRHSGLFMEDMYHPLLHNPVENTAELKRGCLITGSNASGKSTFIKAVAVNAILAQALNTCAARRFEMEPAHIITSMAVRDDLAAGESYFIREIRYLKRILDGLKEDRLTLCVIDEILRGTNTGERIRASRAILQYLADKNCIPVVATHDKELTEMLGDTYDNYHFSEEIGEHDISFSYKILPGPAESHNAVKLLEFAGFPEEIIREAAMYGKDDIDNFL